MPPDSDSEDLPAKIVDFLDSSPWGSLPPMVKCARSLDISVRTLRRRLARNQTTFSVVFEKWRFSKARRLLSNPEMPVAAISAALGYNHPSNFERAFKRWAGCSPTGFRANCKTRPTRNDNTPDRY